VIRDASGAVPENVSSGDVFNARLSQTHTLRVAQVMLVKVTQTRARASGLARFALAPLPGSFAEMLQRVARIGVLRVDRRAVLNLRFQLQPQVGSETVRARERLLAQGRHPSLDAIRIELGNTGSKSTTEGCSRTPPEVRPA
jgi:hypothetical protein